MARFVRGALLTSGLLAAAFGCSQRLSGEAETAAPISEALYQGVDAGGSQSGTVGIFVDGWSRACSGTLLNSQWILTSKTCVTSTNGVWIEVDDSTTDWPNRVVTHPTQNIALIQLHKPFPAAMSPRILYNGPGQSLVGKTVTAYGAGNGSTTDPTPNG